MAEVDHLVGHLGGVEPSKKPVLVASVTGIGSLDSVLSAHKHQASQVGEGSVESGSIFRLFNF